MCSPMEAKRVPQSASARAPHALDALVFRSFFAQSGLHDSGDESRAKPIATSERLVKDRALSLPLESSGNGRQREKGRRGRRSEAKALVAA
jgi:hypothetical protein